MNIYKYNMCSNYLSRKSTYFGFLYERPCKQGEVWRGEERAVPLILGACYNSLPEKLCDMYNFIKLIFFSDQHIN